MNNIRIFIRTFRTNINIKYNRMKKLNLTLCWLFVAVFALQQLCAQQLDRKSTRLNSSHKHRSRMPSSA